MVFIAYIGIYTPCQLMLELCVRASRPTIISWYLDGWSLMVGYGEHRQPDTIYGRNMNSQPSAHVRPLLSRT